ncbi:MAG: hypothetical protein ABI298_01365 [Acidimicrobiales bacterium]
MALARLVNTFDGRDDVVRYANEHHVVISFDDADTITTVASLKDDLTGPVGVWLTLDDAYVAQMAARDVKTLGWIVDLRVVVISAETKAKDRAEVVRQLLTNDEVNFTNDVAHLVGAYNRPAPQKVIEVWSWDGRELVTGAQSLRQKSSESGEAGELSIFR